MRKLAAMLCIVLMGILAGCGNSNFDQTVGMWVDEESVFYLVFNEDGTYGVGRSPRLASGTDVVSPELEWGTWSYEGNLLSMAPDPDSEFCRRLIGTYEMEIIDDGQRMLATLVEDECPVRESGFEGLHIRHTDTTP